MVALLGAASLAMPHFTRLEKHVLLGRLLQARGRGRAVAIVGGRRHAAAVRVGTNIVHYCRGAHGGGGRAVIVVIVDHPGFIFGTPSGERQLWEGGLAKELLII